MKIAKIVARAAVIAALYTGLTYAFAFSSFATYAVQFRISEVLTILPLFWGEAVIGLWIGCLLGNLISAPLDIAFGSTATLIASLMTFIIGRLLRRGNLRVFLGAIPPVIVNAVIVPLTFTVFAGAPEAYPLQFLFVLIGQFAVLAVGGVPFGLGLTKYLTRFRAPKVAEKAEGTDKDKAAESPTAPDTHNRS